MAVERLRRGDCSRHALAAFERRHTLGSASAMPAAVALTLACHLPCALDRLSRSPLLPSALLGVLLR